MTRSLEELTQVLTRRYGDLSLDHVRAWKAQDPQRRAVGSLPVFAPREVVWAAGALPVFVRGGGDQVETIRGDAYYQSYICHLPRSTIELGFGGWLDALDGMLFPNTCDVIRNLSGMWQGMFPKTFVRFLDPPQTYDRASGIEFWRHELERLYADLCGLSGRKPTTDALELAIADYAAARRATRNLARARGEEPWNVPADESYLVRRAGDSMPPLEYVALVDEYLAAARTRKAKREDRIRVVISGAFCEQPPLALLRAVERAGCYVVDDDLTLGADDFGSEVSTAGARDPLEAIARAALTSGTACSVRFDERRDAGRLLVVKAKSLNADGVILAAPSFCDPALLDQPRLVKALEEANIPYTSFKYAENTGQFQGIREQAGTFADSVKLWGHA